MLLLNWLNHVWSWNRGRGDRQPPKERRLRLMRLEQRRVLNADFHFTPNAVNSSLALSNVDTNLTVHETAGGNIEFQLSSGVWTALPGSDPLTGQGTSVLSISETAFDALNTSSITAQTAAHSNISLDASAHDLNLTPHLLTIDGFDNLSSQGPLTTENLTVLHATGEVVFTGPVQSTGTVDITSSGGLGNVRFSDDLTITAGNLIVDASGEAGLDGTTNIQGNIDIHTGTLDLNGNINTFSHGTVTVTNSDVAELGVGLKITSMSTLDPVLTVAVSGTMLT